jgi:hypothetical protein
VTVQRFSRRWLLVAAGAAALVGAGTVTLPAGAVEVDAEGLRGRIADGPIRPYVGYAESTGRLGLPQIPQLESVSTLLTTTTRIRAFVAGADRWRIDQVDNSGERDIYHVGSTEYAWDFGARQLTRIVGSTPLRLPRADDLAPPALARRLLRLGRAEPVAALPARRVAGRDAAGIRLTPTDPTTTVGTVDVWSDVSGDPASALPLRVEVSARGGPPLLFSELQDVRDGAPDPSDVTPTVPPSAGNVAVNAADISGALRVLNAAPPPDRLAGRGRVALSGTPDAALPGVGLYGAGLAGFALVPVSGDIARRAVDGASAAGGATVQVPVGAAVSLTTPLLSVLAWARGRGGVLLMGTVTPDVLQQAVTELPARRRP